MFTGEDGRPVKRTPYSHPYNYDPFVVWQRGGGLKANGSVYTDRLLQWDWGRHNELCRKHFGNEGQVWRNREPEKIEAFMRDWTGDPELVLVKVIECCNQSSGFPLWCLTYRQGRAGATDD